MSNSSSNSPSDSSVATTSGTQEINSESELLSEILITVQSAISRLEPGLPIPEEHRGNGGDITQLVIGIIAFLPQLRLSHDQFVAGLTSNTNQSQGNDEAVFRCEIIIASLIYSLR